MLCPKCGYLITRRRADCPKCKNPLPDGPGEWSEESSLNAPAPENSDSHSDLQEHTPAPKPIVERPHQKRAPRKTKPKDSSEKSDSSEKQPKDEISSPGPLFKNGKPVDAKKEPEIKISFEPPKSEPEKRPVVDAPRTVKPARAPQTTPEPYLKDNATFSSELSTDWIEKYARVHVAPLPERAGLGVRFWAGLVDWMILIAVGVVILLVGKLIITLLDGGAAYSAGELLRVLSIPVVGVWLVLAVLYFTIFVSATGQTPGAMMMDVRVNDEQTKRQPSVGRAFVRAVVYIAGTLFFGAGLWTARFDNNRKGWHDKVAGTRVTAVIKV